MKISLSLIAAFALVVSSFGVADAHRRRHRDRDHDRDGDGIERESGDRHSGRRGRHGRIHPCLVLDFDVDGDGELSDEERAAAVEARRQEILDEFDVDGDGELSEEEIAAAREAREAARDERTAERLAAMDTDGDGEVSEEERESYYAARLAEIDTDGDGEVSDEERAAALEARCAEGEMTEEEADEDDAIEELAFAADFRRGDVNEDGAVDISDQIAVLNFLFLGGAQPRCMDAADSNDDGIVNIADPSMALTTLFLGGEPLPAPSVAPGVDPTPDALECDGFSAS